MKCSICIATYNKPRYLYRVLQSITNQQPPFAVEVIVVDDGSPGDETLDVCNNWLHPLISVHYTRIDREAVYRNPSAARNVACRKARGDVLICQSDDVVHSQPDTIQRLAAALKPGTFVLARVVNTDWLGKPTPCLHPHNPKLVELVNSRNERPLLFLGAIYREDMYAVGGCEERFTAPGRDDVYLADCLMKGRGLTPVFLDDVVGHHLHHERPADTIELCKPSQQLYRQLAAEGRWIASGGPWPWPKGAIATTK